MSQSGERPEDVTYETFRRFASDRSLSKYQRIGFPDSYRAGFEPRIFEDIIAKVPRLLGPPGLVIDIGPGCSDLPSLLIDHCAARGHRLVLMDSPEMLAWLPERPFIRKVPGRFPKDCEDVLSELGASADAVISYSVFHYVFAEGSVFQFFDAVLALLAPGGAAIIGDIPNQSMRRRFFASTRGKAFHRQFTKTTEDPIVEFNHLDPGAIDDAVLVGLMLRARAMGFDAYVLPQSDGLPMANRREDLLVVRP
jgi:Methyltransferase domain